MAGEGVDRHAALDTSRFDEATARRMARTVQCRDCDPIPKVDGAGGTVTVGDRLAQVMHNGVLVEHGGYFGDWMAEIIRALHGHHEPQEERVFDAIVRRVAESGSDARMIEFGSFWAYYGMWFLKSVPTGSLVALEPDPANLELGQRNAALNGVSDRCRFIHAAVGADPGARLEFRAESDGELHRVVQHDLGSVMSETGMDRVDVVLCDAQGAETVLLERAGPRLRSGQVRFLVISTHHHSISGDPLTHQRCLSMLEEAGAHIVAEHSVTESFSGDGLIAAAFDPGDRDLVVPISYSRAKESLFGELEHDLAGAYAERLRLQVALDRSEARAESLERSLEETQAGLEQVRMELDATRATRAWRLTRPPAHLYHEVRRRVQSR